MNQHNWTKDRQVRGCTPTFIAKKGTCQMPGTGMTEQESLKDAFPSTRNGLKS